MDANSIFAIIAVSLVGILCLIPVCFFLVKISALIGESAERKGQNATIWILMAIFLSPFVLLLLFLIPDRKDLADAAMLRTGAAKKCPFCAEIIKREAVVCRYCGRDLLLGSHPA